MSVNNWKHKRPREYFYKIKKQLGQPLFVANVKGGMAQWNTKGLFCCHKLLDEDVKHCVPANHHDYFYSTVKFYVPPERLLDVLSISGSINYDGLKKEMTARCGGIGANIATLYLGMMVGSGKLNIKKVKKDDMYVKHIRGEAKEHKEMRKEMMKMKRKNNKKYSKQMKAQFYKLAFKKC